MCERELETEQRLQHIEPQLFWLSQPFFPVLLGCSTGGLGAWEPSLCWDMVLIPASSPQPTRTSCRRGYIIIWHPPTSGERQNFALNSTPRLSRSPLISWYLRPDAPVITQVYFFFWQLGRVGGQYATIKVNIPQITIFDKYQKAYQKSEWYLAFIEDWIKNVHFGGSP